MASSQQAAYEAFTTGIASDDQRTMRTLIARGFRAELGKGTLTFDQFLLELARQRTAFPDLAKNVKVTKIDEGNRYIRVAYDMTVNFTGPLTDGRGGSIPPTGRRVVIVSSDYVEFDTAGKIVKFTVSSNMEMTVEQMF